MSAIFGIIRFDGEEVSRREIERMGNVLAHRGPDGRHAVAEGPMGMGHCLLRVNQEDWHEAQPLQDGPLTLVADVRLDNREELAEQIGIGTADLAEMSDSAVLLAAYRQWGEACVDHLLGDFAFAIWNARERSLLLVRDPMGQRGIYFHHADGFFVFASEMKALWAIEGVPRRLSEGGLGRRILLPVEPNPGHTVYDGIHVQSGGALLRLTGDGALSRHVYWEPHAAPEHLGRDEAYYYAAYRKLVTEAIACRVRRLIRAPALCFSGGFDSGTIAAVAGPIVGRKGHRVVAVASVLEEGERRLVSDARVAVEAFRPMPYLDVHYYTRGEDSFFSEIESVFAAADDPAGASYVRRGLYRIARENGARLILDGHGGDYTVNVNNKAMLGRILIRGKPIHFLREFRMRMRATGRSWPQVLRHDVYPALVPSSMARLVRRFRRRSVPLWRDRGISADFAQRLFDGGKIDPQGLRDMHSWRHRWRAYSLHFLRKVLATPPLQPTLAAAQGLDFTRPYHDRRIVELGLALPEGLEFRNGLERHLARHVFADLLPPRLINRGPGNDAEDPDMARMVMQAAPAMLMEVRKLDSEKQLTRYIDLDWIERTIARADEGRRGDHASLYLAGRLITYARFISWLDRAN